MNDAARPMTWPVVRVATRGDHGAIREVLRAAYQQYAGIVPADIFDAYLAELVDLDARRRSGADLLVATLDGRVVGSVSCYPDGRTAPGFTWPAGVSVMRALGVAPGTRHQGIARRLLHAAVDRAAAAGATSLGLHTGEFMTAARALYERLGFVRRPSLDVLAGDVTGRRFAAGPLVMAYELVLDELRPFREGEDDSPSDALVAV